MKTFEEIKKECLKKQAEASKMLNDAARLNMNVIKIDNECESLVSGLSKDQRSEIMAECKKQDKDSIPEDVLLYHIQGGPRG